MGDGDELEESEDDGDELEGEQETSTSRNSEDSQISKLEDENKGKYEKDSSEEGCIQLFCGKGEKEWDNKKCYKNSTVKYHPDKTNNDEKKTKLFHKLNNCQEAFEGKKQLCTEKGK